MNAITDSKPRCVPKNDQIAAAREAAVPKIEVGLNLHGWSDFETAQSVAKRMERFNPMWPEEPMPAENIDACKAIAGSPGIPICRGENNHLAHGFSPGLFARRISV